MFHSFDSYCLWSFSLRFCLPIFPPLSSTCPDFCFSDSPPVPPPHNLSVYTPSWVRPVTFWVSILTPRDSPCELGRSFLKVRMHSKHAHSQLRSYLVRPSGWLRRRLLVTPGVQAFFSLEAWNYCWHDWGWVVPAGPVHPDLQDRMCFWKTADPVQILPLPLIPVMSAGNYLTFLYALDILSFSRLGNYFAEYFDASFL